MSEKGTSPFEPFFLSSPHGRLFSVYFPPSLRKPPLGGVLFVPPFAEELNKARRQMSLQARALAGLGYGVLIVDQYGTGDSDGAFGEATWESWQAGLNSAIAWLIERGMARISLVAVRLGALLTMDYLQQYSHDVDNIVLLQPVSSGKLYMTQFLRLRTAAEVLQGQKGGAVAKLRSELSEGKLVEIAGYEINPDLFFAIEEKDLVKITAPDDSRISIIEVTNSPGGANSPMIKKLVETWQLAGANSQGYAVAGEQFWATPEISIAKDVISLTADLIGGINNES